jgi:dipeptidase D
MQQGKLLGSVLKGYTHVRCTVISSITLLMVTTFVPLFVQANVSSEADKVATYAVDTYQKQMLESLRALVKYDTVAVEGVSSVDNPKHIAFKAELASMASELGLDYKDDGYIVIIGLGKNKQRLGMITHGDIQPSTPEKWAKSPFELDTSTEPGKLIGRGTEDDKGPIVNALYAMKAIKDSKITLNKRIELYVYMAEESDWQPLKDYIKTHSLPQMNITLDAEYPVVSAEKGYGTLSVTFPEQAIDKRSVYLSHFGGGFFGSQIPEDAVAIINNANSALLVKIKAQEKLQYQSVKQKNNGVKPKDTISYSYQWQGSSLTIKALGRSAHSSKPEDGINAISYLAELLAFQTWPNNDSGTLVNFINDNLGIDLYGEKFGNIAYRDDFMGDMSVQATVIKKLNEASELNINIRRPRGKTSELLEREIRTTLTQWQQKNQVTLSNITVNLNTPFVQTNAPQVATLLNVFSHYTGIKNAQPISIGGGTNSRLFPTAVSFGPSMPGKEYSGHTEHEFITEKQFLLNLKMYTAALIELSK